MSVVDLDHVVHRTDADLAARAQVVPSRGPRVRRRPWWLASAVAGLVLTALLIASAARGPTTGGITAGTVGWWLTTVLLHLPYLTILFFLAGGFVERVGYYWRGRDPQPAGDLPTELPKVCVQLPMFNEHLVARRVIEAASAMTWPVDRFSVQVLDDSTDEACRAVVVDVCAQVRASTGVDCSVRHRTHRHGYKAGALEDGRQQTDAEFLAIFDADFVPPADFLVRTMPHFFLADGEPDHGLALVQAQWGHLNHDESSLTMAQSLWVDDHHTLQMSWRSAKWQFVNFTGTAGVWRSSAIDSAGGWRAASLVEDCELSFRSLFAGYRTKFVKEIVVPAELPATSAAYKAQQRRWTRGWVQLQRMHLMTLLLRFRCPALRRLHLAYHMCISWQWPAWAIWTMTLPLLIYSGHWFGGDGMVVGVVLYLLPTSLWAAVASAVASLETRHTYADRITRSVFCRRFGRILPYVVLNAGMLPHQFSSFAEGLFGGLHGEFERTPKAASVTSASVAALAGPVTAPRGVTRVDRATVQWPYVLAEAYFVAYQLTWTVLFAASGLMLCAAGAAYLALCVVLVARRPSGDARGRERRVRPLWRQIARRRRRAPASTRPLSIATRN